MKQILTSLKFIGAIALIALATGCASTQPKENLLSAAGFKTIVASTPRQLQQLKTLPPGQVTLVQRHGKNIYVFPDAAKGELFVGTPQQYQTYQQLRLANKLSNQNLQAAQLNQDTMMDMNGGWEAWGAMGLY